MHHLNSWLRIAVGFVLVALVSPVFAVAMLAVFPWRALRIELFNLYGKLTGRIVMALAGVSPRVLHRERLKSVFPAVYIANHTSTLDAFLLFWLSPPGVAGVVKREIARIPFFGQVYWLSGNLLINRKDRAGSVATLKAAVDFVRRYGLGFMIMPEGTRSRDGRLLPFKTGFVHLAIDMGLSVVPIVLHGVHKGWSKGTLELQSTEVELEVLPPIDTSSWTHESAQAHANATHALFVAALREDQKPSGTSATAQTAQEPEPGLREPVVAGAFGRA